MRAMEKLVKREVEAYMKPVLKQINDTLNQNQAMLKQKVLDLEKMVKEVCEEYIDIKMKELVENDKIQPKNSRQ